MSTHDDDGGSATERYVRLPSDPDHVWLADTSARALHEAVERIALGERRYIAGMTGFGALVFLALSLAAAWTGSTGHAAGFGGAFGAALADWLYLRFTRPRSVKPWGATDDRR